MDGRRRTEPWVLVSLLVVLALTFAGSAFAQGQNGTLTGIVADGDGIVPGATVTATDPTTGLVRTRCRTIAASSASVGTRRTVHAED